MAEEAVITLLKQKGVLLNVRNLLFEVLNKRGILAAVQARVQENMKASRLVQDISPNSNLDEKSMDELKEKLLLECFEGDLKQQLIKEIEIVIEQSQAHYTPVIREAMAISSQERTLRMEQ